MTFLLLLLLTFLHTDILARLPTTTGNTGCNRGKGRKGAHLIRTLLVQQVMVPPDSGSVTRALRGNVAGGTLCSRIAIQVSVEDSGVQEHQRQAVELRQNMG